MMLQSTHCKLRAVNPEDLDYIYELENNSEFWQISNTITPYSKYTINEYLQHAHKDIYEVKQLRLALCTLQDQVIGIIDLYDFDPYNQRAGIGVVITDQQHRQQGYAYHGLQLMIDYAFNHLRLHQLYAGVIEDNMASRQLFNKLRFRESGIKKDWIATGKNYKNEIIYQLINE